MILHVRIKKRRGVSEVISTILILAITMVGAVFVSSLIQNSMLTATDQTKHTDVSSKSVRLIGYDTRDSTNLSQIVLLDNKLDQKLCTISCSLNKDNIPTGLAGEGTEFLIIQIRNSNINPVYLQNIWINNIEHSWDGQTAGKLFDSSIDDYTGKYPLSGKFSIIPWDNGVPLIQQTSVKIENDQEVRIVIKLHDSFPDDLELWRPMKIDLNFGTPEPAEFIILSGDSR